MKRSLRLIRRTALRVRSSALLALALAAACATSPGAAPGAASVPNVERGRLLYEASCSACHSTQPHWRAQRLAKSWPDLLAQVDRWQRVAGAQWTADDVRDVAIYLNEQFYHLPCDACGGPAAAR